MGLQEKLTILADSAKYDASCSSSGSNRKSNNGLGSTSISGICHSFASDGRCISLLKILLTNCCIFDCKYCLNRKSNNIKRAVFTPEEICTITLNFYRRNYIEGLFLSSGIIKSPDYTMELLIKTISMLRHKYHFNGYIHAKAIPGASQKLLKELGTLVDRLSANIELPTENGLKLLAPNKESKNVAQIMKYIKDNQNKKYVPAGQSTQMIIGATKETDLQIMNQSFNLYEKFHLKRVFYSAYVPVNKDNLLPTLEHPPLVRENRLYQADWLLRYYNFKVGDLLDAKNPNFNILLDPKVDWALRHLKEFPKEINTCSYFDLLKIPGIGVKSAKRIISSRRHFTIHLKDLKRMGVILKRAQYFILCNNKYIVDKRYFKKEFIERNIILEENIVSTPKEQLRLF
ncbi:MAG: putative DNA modification/repair radical SAM protein [Bacilli bacterium]|jgi:putative DNA modification/repair radical SAM protein|nr:putative DNA modification/repair radical SAM protein [Bacilli bacterium]